MAPPEARASSARPEIFASLAGIAAIAYSVMTSMKGGEDTKSSFIMNFIHLAAFSAWFGTQLWVTFIAALTMFKHLSRHSFGHIQNQLFPRYFSFGILLTAVILATYLQQHPFGTWDPYQVLHIAVLGAGLAMLLVNAVLLSPTTKTIMTEMFKIEKEEGIGEQVNSKTDFTKVKAKETWKALHKKFGMLHGLSSVANLVTLLSNIFHLYFLANNLKEI